MLRGAGPGRARHTLALHGLLRGEGPAEESPAKRELRYAFMEAARRELGVEEAALRRGLPFATGPDSRSRRPALSV